MNNTNQNPSHAGFSPGNQSFGSSGFPATSWTQTSDAQSAAGAGFSPPPTAHAQPQFNAPTGSGFSFPQVGGADPRACPLPILERGKADVLNVSVRASEITARPEATLRSRIKPTRVAQLRQRALKLAHFPPLIVWQAPDNQLVLVDGWHRLEAFLLLGIDLISVVVITDPLDKALVLALEHNKPKNKALRSDDDAARALKVLATALGRAVGPEEAASLGLAYSENAPLDPLMMRCWPMPSLSRELVVKPSEKRRIKKPGAKPAAAKEKFRAPTKRAKKKL